MTGLMGFGAGVLAAVGMVVLFHRAGPHEERRLYAVALVVAALIYVFFARGAAAEWVLLELGGVAVYAAVAILGVRGSPWLLVFGWAFHVLWDLGIHTPSLTPFVPAVYPWLCVGFDLVVAVAIAARIRGVGGETHWKPLF